jgi:hypothetical protein
LERLRLQLVDYSVQLRLLLLRQQEDYLVVHLRRQLVVCSVHLPQQQGGYSALPPRLQLQLVGYLGHQLLLRQADYLVLLPHKLRQREGFLVQLPHLRLQEVCLGLQLHPLNQVVSLVLLLRQLVDCLALLHLLRLVDCLALLHRQLVDYSVLPRLLQLVDCLVLRRPLQLVDYSVLLLKLCLHNNLPL